ncbi:phage major capsid protein [Clostridium paraputrificum]|uniref:phage major capsid protein n=1 Tax=Clostridium paraputrificum TaxID=29363 RepID=UPI00189DA016|nr:phage major capsid protein [Clostridium paraputrificum]MDU4147947.1 phage major capsid protein [Bifidobacterium breve]
MPQELRELLNKINAKKEEVKNLAKENKIEEAKAAKKELIDLQAKFDVLYDLEDEAVEKVKNDIENDNAKVISGVANKGKELANAFVNAIKAGLTKKPVAEKDMEILNSMKEGTPEDGGLTVPQDIQTSIKELRRSQDALENLVNVETVSTETGTRVIEKAADQTPFDNVDEEAEFPDVSTPQFEKISYKVKKKGGILKVTRELLQDTAENILGYLRRWIAKKSKATRNALIVNKINEITNSKEVAIKDLDGLKDIFNVNLDPAIVVTSGILTNQNGFNWLDKLKDSDGKYVLQSNPTNLTQKLLFGVYPVTVVSNKVLPSKGVGSTGEETAWKHPFICGDLKEAITIFDRENMTIEISTEAGDLWGKDQTGIKVRERLDIQAVDSEAIVKAEVEIEVTP